MTAAAETATLPDDLTARGWKLVTRAPDRMFAVSTAWGCTGTKSNVEAVITEAKSLTEFIEWMSAKENDRSD